MYKKIQARSASLRQSVRRMTQPDSPRSRYTAQQAISTTKEFAATFSLNQQQVELSEQEIMLGEGE